ncbi:MAG: rRNA maturation RNase YbeY [Candidatus Hydrogenedentes bacterium]|nr:rRNA maturation RNase YbeY [Candidatus Hydrogenedentota bacterium]
MTVTLGVRNTSRVKGCCRADKLRRLAGGICEGEGIGDDVEISVLLCDDAEIQELNRSFRRQNRPTDVLSFGQDQAAPGLVSRVRPAVLGDIVISLETVRHRCKGDMAAMRQEVCLLFCHGLLHLLGYDHATAEQRRNMAAKQAQYLGLSLEEAWLNEPQRRTPRPKRGEGRQSIGR